MKTSKIPGLATRLRAAAGILLGSGYRDSHDAVNEAVELIIRPILSPAQEEALRTMITWHHAQYEDYKKRGDALYDKASGNLLNRDSREAFERASNGFYAKANVHLRFIQSLSDVLPDTKPAR